MTVYLVGAGPGDPGLLTVRGRDLLMRCDVVLYDALVDPRILTLARLEATQIDVGKRAAKHTAAHHAAAQETINALLVEYGRTAGCVVRLKGGDPFVFGRGGEEALALAAAGVPFEVVPGVSSAIAVPAYAGIPVTHRGVASSVAVVTGHEAARGSSSVTRETGPKVCGQLAATADTLVVLMGVGHVAEIVGALIAKGRSADTPAAVIEQGTTPQQRVISGRLEDIPLLVAEAQVRSPAVIVVGDVVGLRPHLRWYDSGGAGANTPVPAQIDGSVREPIACG